LVRDGWPGGVGRLNMDDKEHEEMEPFEVVPTSAEGISDWAVVAPIPRPSDPSRRWTIIHNPADAPAAEQVYPLSLRVQGVLGRHNLQVFGNWDQTERNACKAVQTVVLVPGNYWESFTAQRHTIDIVRRLIIQATGGSARRIESNADEIFCQRRVFKKVSWIFVRDHADRILTSYEDALGVARLIDQRWRVVDKIKFGRRTIEGKVKTCKPTIFSEGDLVDITMNFDIATVSRNHGETSTVVHL
ncbi:hypothetical protein FA95DRAFT_1478263, partial [Auriscalpium vulgare]